MGRQTLLTVARDASVDDLAAAGLQSTGEELSARDAAAHGLRSAMSAVEVRGDAVIIGGVDPDHDLADELARALRVEVVSTRFMSSVGYFAWIVHHAGGVRTLECGEGEVVVDEGIPLPEEGGTVLLDARTLRSMLAARTGVTDEDWLPQTARELRRTPPRRRGLFRRR